VPSDNLYQTAFASSIVATDGYLLSGHYLHVDGRSHTPVGVACNAVGYFDYWVHFFEN
jgi:hypothetical protein